MKKKIYTATSWRNERVIKHIAKMLREWGHEVYCFAEQGKGQHIFNWSDVITPDDDGITCLDTEDAEKGFANDKSGLDWANTCVLFNPCGRDAHLEAGFIKGKGGQLFIIGHWDKGEFSLMYKIADGLIRLDELSSMNYFRTELERRIK